MSGGPQGARIEAGAALVRDAYLADFEALEGNGAPRAPEWVRSLRRSAIERFAELGFPSPREEAWRFTNIQPLVETRFTAPSGPRTLPGRETVQRLLLGRGGWPHLVVVDGRYVPELSSAAGLPAGPRLGGLADAVERDEPLVRPHLAQHARYDRGAFAALGTAFLADGAFVYLPPEATVEAPIEILHLTTAGERPTAVHPRTLVIADRQSQATVFESFACLGAGRYFSNGVSEVVVGDAARVGYYRVQREGADAFQVATTHTHQGRDSVLIACAVALGSKLARHDLVSVLDGPGADLTLNGLYLLGGWQHVDHHMLVEHAQPDCGSHELFNGILDQHARAVFTGKILVRPGAQRTDAKQVNNNLLLSEDARADSQPQLEIYADDVKCTHGSTLGPIDDRGLFYLRSRGLDRDDARALLTYGFAADILRRIPTPEVRAALERMVLERLGQRRRAKAGAA